MSDVDHVPNPPPGRRLHASDGIIVVLIAIALLVVFRGESIRNSGEELDSGVERTVVLVLGTRKYPDAQPVKALPVDIARQPLEALARLDADDTVLVVRLGQRVDQVDLHVASPLGHLG